MLGFVLGGLLLCFSVSALGQTTDTDAGESGNARFVQKVPPEWKTALLLPYFDNIPHFDYGRDLVTQAIIEVCQDKGLKVTRVEESEYRREWQEIVNNVNGLFIRKRFALDVAAANLALNDFARRIGPDAPYDGVLIPTLLLRRAELHSYYAQWDGVKRKVKFKTRPGGMTTGKGIVNGVSLDLIGLDRGLAAKVSEGTGGLVLPFEYDWLKKKAELLPEMFADHDEVADGVELAVDQFLENRKRIYNQRFLPEPQ